jgi:hypothetical protein
MGANREAGKVRSTQYAIEAVRPGPRRVESGCFMSSNHDGKPVGKSKLDNLRGCLNKVNGQKTEILTTNEHQSTQMEQIFQPRMHTEPMIGGKHEWGWDKRSAGESVIGTVHEWKRIIAFGGGRRGGREHRRRSERGWWVRGRGGCTTGCLENQAERRWRNWLGCYRRVGHRGCRRWP